MQKRRRVAKKKYSKIKKNILIISLFDFNSKHKYFFLNKLNKSFDISTVSLKKYLSKNSVLKLKKRLKNILKNNKFDYCFDLLPIPDYQYKENLYRKNLTIYFEVRKIIKKIIYNQ